VLGNGSRFYGSRGSYSGKSIRSGSTTRFYDGKGAYAGKAVNSGSTTRFSDQGFVKLSSTLLDQIVTPAHFYKFGRRVYEHRFDKPTAAGTTGPRRLAEQFDELEAAS